MYKLLTARSFKRDAKPLLKKHPSLSKELAQLGAELQENPTIGTPLGKNCYKTRLAIKSKGKGESEGARMITYCVSENKEIVFLAIYDKQVKDDLAPNELDLLLRDYE